MKTYIDKVIKVVQLLVESDGETNCCRQNLLAHMTDTFNMIENAIYVYIYGKIFLVDLKDFQQEKRSYCEKLLLDVTPFVKSFISLV